MTHDRVRSDYVVFMPCACCNSGVLHSVHVLKTLHVDVAVVVVSLSLIIIIIIIIIVMAASSVVVF